MVEGVDMSLQSRSAPAAYSEFVRAVHSRVTADSEVLEVRLRPLEDSQSLSCRVSVDGEISGRFGRVRQRRSKRTGPD